MHGNMVAIVHASKIYILQNSLHNKIKRFMFGTNILPEKT